jgi:hypothetical protein
MFGLFSKKPKYLREADEVYSTRQHADAALVAAATTAEQAVIVASFFPASLARITERLRPAGANVEPLGRSRPSRLAGTTWLLDVKAAGPELASVGWLLDAGQSVRFLFTEHFPIAASEQRVLDFIDEASAPNAHAVRFFVGLDDGLMQVFGSERVLAMMQQLGLAPDEKISHPLVTKSIANAQKKIERRVTAPSPAESEAEWFAMNLGK